MSEKRKIDDADLKEIDGAGELSVAKKVPPIEQPFDPPVDDVDPPDTDDRDTGNQEFGN